MSGEFASNQTEPTSDSVSEDFYCVACKYNLRSLRTDANCPECGLRIKLSLQRPLIACIDPAWIASLNKASFFSTVKTRYLSGLYLAFCAIFWWMEIESGIFSLCIAYLVLIIGIYNSWAFSTPPTTQILDSRILLASKVAHCTALLVLISAILVITVPWIQGSPRGLFSFPMVAFASPVGFVGAAYFVSLAVYCKGIGELLCEQFATMKSDQYFWGYAISWSIFMLSFGANQILGVVPLYVVSFLAVIGVVAFSLLILCLPSMLGKSIVRNVKEAQEWAKSQQTQSNCGA